MEWNSKNTLSYITGMGSRNLIVVNADGVRINPQPIELGEGPTGLALDEARERLYVWNRFSSSISVVDTSAGVVITNVPVAEFKAMLSTISFPPNFYRTFSNTLAASVPLPGHFGTNPAGGGARSPLPPGDPSKGLVMFQSICNSCHDPNRGVTSDLVLFQTEPRFGANFSGEPRFGAESFKFAQLRSLAEKGGMDGNSTNSRAGFGFMHDGRIDTLTRFLVDGFGGNPSNGFIASGAPRERRKSGRQRCAALGIRLGHELRGGVDHELPCGRDQHVEHPGFTVHGHDEHHRIYRRAAGDRFAVFLSHSQRALAHAKNEPNRTLVINGA